MTVEQTLHGSDDSLKWLNLIMRVLLPIIRDALFDLTSQAPARNRCLHWLVQSVD